MTARTTYPQVRFGGLRPWRLQLFLAALLLISLSGAPALAASLPDAFVGKFRGVLTSGTGEVEGDFNMTAKSTRYGFTMSWPTNEDVEFEVTNQKNIFHAQTDGRTIEGAPVRWARLEGSTLVVYSLRIDEHGGYDVDTFIYSPMSNGLTLTMRRLRTGSQPLESTGKLERYGH